MENVRVLLVEDDKNLGDLLSEYLTLKGYPTSLSKDGEEGWNNFQNQEFDFCIFDVMLPKLDGFSLAEKVREKNKFIPILFLTARAMKEDTIHGLKIGADDYMTKPFRMEELLLRMQAILRRTNKVDDDIETDLFKIGKYEFDYIQHKLTINNITQKLTSKEAELLKMLCESKNQTLDRSFTLKKIWKNDSYFNARSMDVYITKLRKFLKDDDKLQILNIHGQGFKLIELS
ncbi:MAG: DNA-binding response regulator [Bacteroidetes bacterium]|nr:MAG: DNA-binding response regulator [Bacteroidota bacterium]TAG95702.1 MAG: DNA-binding response regulator [Bacteroidota bacterium]